MKVDFLAQAGKLLKEHKQYRRRVMVFLCLAVIVTFGTVTALKLSGQAMTHRMEVLDCQYEVHQHTEDCYEKDEEGNPVGDPVCGYADYAVHVHNDRCYDGNGKLVCTLEEHEKHEHTEDCYVTEMILVCGETADGDAEAEDAVDGGEVPAENDGKASAGEETENAGISAENGEAPAGDAEKTAEAEASESAEAPDGAAEKESGGESLEQDIFCGKEGHIHDENCYEKVLSCGYTEEHVHNTDCIAHELTCEETEHKHNEECYAEDGTLVCDMEEHAHEIGCYDEEGNTICNTEDHVHDESCLNEEGKIACGPEGHEHITGCYRNYYICGKEVHFHTEDCYTENLLCEKEEHEHVESCYINTEESVPAAESGEPEANTELSESGTDTQESDMASKEEKPDAAGDGASAEEGTQGHVHTEACYKEVTRLICGEAELHTHDDSCYEQECFDENGSLIPGSRPSCGQMQLEEHIHEGECFRTVELTPEEVAALNNGAKLHIHTDKCYGEDGSLICGHEETHIHGLECYDEAGNLICGHEATHIHDENCYDEEGNLICGYTEKETYCCGKEEHAHTEGCYDEESNLTCGMEEHEHDDSCLKKMPEYDSEKIYKGDGYIVKVAYQEDAGIPEEAELVAAQITKESDPDHYAQREAEAREVLGDENADVYALFDIGFYLDGEKIEPKTPVNVTIQFLDENELPEGTPFNIVHFGEDENEILQSSDVDSEGNTAFETDSFSEFLMVAEGNIAVTLGEPPVGNNIKEKLDTAVIMINGVPYDGVSELNPGEQFSVKLGWTLGRADLTVKEYQYTFPEQIHILDVGTEESPVELKDENGNKKGVYYVKDNVLTVIYDKEEDYIATNFELQATWNRDKISDDTRIEWNEKLHTDVKFNNCQIAVTKKLLENSQENLADGSLAGIYQVRVDASGKTDSIELVDTLDSQYFDFYKGGIKSADGQTIYDYRYKIVATGEDDAGEWSYGNFEAKIDAEDKNKKKIVLDGINLEEGQSYIVEYGVILPGNKRLELDATQSPAKLRNTAEASYDFDDKKISSSVTVEDTYQMEDKWINKTKDDGETNPDAPWRIVVNPERIYDMGGAVVGDVIDTPKVYYDKSKQVKVKITSNSGGSEKSEEKALKWIELDGGSINAILNANSSGTSVMDLLFTAEGNWVLENIKKAIRPDEIKEKNDLSNYVFVNNASDESSKSSFVWFAPQNGEPATYELTYHTDISNADSNVVSNSAIAGFKSYKWGDVVGSFVQKAELEKSNTEVREEDGNYYVDWTITLTVPGGCDPIENVFLYDQIPVHWNITTAGGEVTGAVDWLVGPAFDEGVLDCSTLRAEGNYFKSEALENITRGAFNITSTSTDPAVQECVANAKTTLGRPKQGVGWDDFVLYKQDSGLTEEEWNNLGQLECVGGLVDGQRFTARTFGIWLGELPSTKGREEGYTITVEYTTQVNPMVISQLEGQSGAINYVDLRQYNVDHDTVLIDKRPSPYFVYHTSAEHCLEKDVKSFDPETRTLTYQVNINPDVNLGAGVATYTLTDLLNIPNARFKENSFKLTLLGTLEKGESKYIFTYDPAKETVIWVASGEKTDLVDEETEGAVRSCIELTFPPNNGNEEFVLKIEDAYDQFKLTGPEEYEKKFPPMILTYEVEVPEGGAVAGESKLVNSVSFSRSQGGTEKLLDTANTEFDYSSAMHKQLRQNPTYKNGYKAGFSIDVNTTAETLQEKDKFTVVDEMSKSLELDVSTIKVWGVKSETKERVQLENSAYTAAYDPRGNDKNVLRITISNAQSQYSGYHIEYDAKVQGKVNETVSYSNGASIEGTDIKSEAIEKRVDIQKQDAGVSTYSVEVQLWKYDSENITDLLRNVSFRLYEYQGKDGEGNAIWSEARKVFCSGDTLQNTDDYPDLLKFGYYYKLEETEAPQGYLKGVTYFRIPERPNNNPVGSSDSAAEETLSGQSDSTDPEMTESESYAANTTPIPDKPEEYQTVPLNDKDAKLMIPNYKAKLEFSKVDAANYSKMLAGAEFKLYSEYPREADAVEVNADHTESNGKHTITITQPETGRYYYLQEKKAPAGYILSDTVYRIQFDGEGKVTVWTESAEDNDTAQEDGNGRLWTEYSLSDGIFQIPNESGYELPETGGFGSTLYTIAGVLCMLFGTGFLYKKKFRERRA